MDCNRRCEPIEKYMEAKLKKYPEHLEELVQRRTEALENANAQLQKYKILAQNARDIMLFVRLDGSIIEANEAAIRTYGFTREELLDMTIYDLRGNLYPKAAEPMERASIKGILFETLHKCKDGRILPVEVSSQGTNIDNERVLLCVVRDITERKKAEEQLKYMAMHDYLTEIPNRYYLEEYLRRIAAGVLLFLDIDNFKVINDTFGHAAGDKLLVDLAQKLKAAIKQNDFLARLGGDEFAIVLREADLDEAKKVAQKIIKMLSEANFSVDAHGNCCNLSVSIGVTKIDDVIDTQKLFAYADVALYRAKQDGKRRVVSVETSDEKFRLSETNFIVKRINDCLKNNRFILHYQPVVSGNRIIHYEALLRMLDYDGTVLYPDSFITTAERCGLMTQIDGWVIRSVINTLRCNPDVSIFVNISPSSLGDEELIHTIELALADRSIKPGRIGFEITETAAIKDLILAAQWINRLKRLGCKFALDDFGVGFTSFSYLQKLPVDYLKIDGSFIRNLEDDLTQKALVQAMNAVAHALGKKTIAEFVENEKIWSIVREMGVDFGQGYFLGKPIPGLCDLTVSSAIHGKTAGKW